MDMKALDDATGIEYPGILKLQMAHSVEILMIVLIAVEIHHIQMTKCQLVS